MPIALALTTAGGMSAAGRIAAWAADEVISGPPASLPDPGSILADRSPGERESGAMFQTKPAYPMLNDASGLPAPPVGENLIEAAPLPQTDEVPKAFNAIIPPDDTTPFTELAPPGAPPTTPIIVPVETGPVLGPPNQPILGTPPIVPVIVGDSPTTPDTPVLTTPTVPGVPEPASWATMIAGFLVIGAMLRRRTRRGTNRLPEVR